jgi:hypothetical protein
LALQFRLVSANLLVLLKVPYFLSLKLIANQSSRAQSNTAANRRPCPRMAHGGANDTACSSASESADTRSFLSGAERPTRTARKQ